MTTHNPTFMDHNTATELANFTRSADINHEDKKTIRAALRRNASEGDCVLAIRTMRNFQEDRRDQQVAEWAAEGE